MLAIYWSLWLDSCRCCGRSKFVAMRDLVKFHASHNFIDKFLETKNQITVKVVFGSTPCGLISYLSPTYRGSASDRSIIENGEILKSCSRGDSNIADKGFEVRDLFVPFDVTVNIHART